jgi:hypothetical protein
MREKSHWLLVLILTLLPFVRPQGQDQVVINNYFDSLTGFGLAMMDGTADAAYGSMRMQPVFMVLGQSATAAALALEEGTSVQLVPYEKLKIHLERDGQILKISG